jgi:Raf kinase inhibitor-like YbhB/YbcL family protein
MIEGKEGPMELVLAALTFADGETIPEKHTCEGPDVSPGLKWSGAPPGTKSFALIVDDPDAPDPAAPKMTWVHWVVYNIPADMAQFPEDALRKGSVAGAAEGLNDWNETGWRGPCPPKGRHRYFFKLYALDAALPLQGPVRKPQLEAAMQGRILAEAQLMGTYEKQKA